MAAPARLSSWLWALVFSLVLSLALSLVVGYGALLLGSLLPRLAGSLGAASLVEALVYVSASLFVVKRLDGRLASNLFGSERPSAGALFAGAGLGLALHGPADFVEAWVETWFPLPPSVTAERIARLLPPTLAERATLLICVAIIVPLVEELFFRGALFAALGRVAGVTAALACSALAFTVSHAEPRSFAALSLVAVVLGILRLATGSLVPCLLLHASFNATTLLLLFTGPGEIGPPRPSLPSFVVGSVLTILFLILVMRQSSREKASPA